MSEAQSTPEISIPQTEIKPIKPIKTIVSSPEPPKPPPTPSPNEQLQAIPRSELVKTGIEEVNTRFKNLIKNGEISVARGDGLFGPDKKKIYGEENWQHTMGFLYGKEISRGSTCRVYLNEKDGTITKLFEPLQERNNNLAGNQRQIDIYKQHAGKHPFLTFLGEVPGGWQQQYFPNDGNLKEFLDKGGTITDDEINQAIRDASELVQITGVAHGDLIKDPKYLDHWNREVMRKGLEEMEPFGYIDYRQILVGKPDSDGKRKLIFIDWAGAETSVPLGDRDPQSEIFKQNEIQSLIDGFKTIKNKQASTI